MKNQSWLLSVFLSSVFCLLLTSDVLAEKPNDDPISLDVARDRVKLLHKVYKSTLDVMHHRYFHGQDRKTVPARAMEDVFSDMERTYDVQARWISVNLKPMNIDHEPRTDFEKKAVAEIKSGKREVESSEDGYYRRAVAIPLSGGCVGCHSGLFRQSTVKPFAGLVVSIPFEGKGESAKK